MVIRDGERLGFEKCAALGCDAVFLEAALGFFGVGVFDEVAFQKLVDCRFVVARRLTVAKKPKDVLSPEWMVCDHIQ